MPSATHWSGLMAVAAAVATTWAVWASAFGPGLASFSHLALRSSRETVVPDADSSAHSYTTEDNASALVWITPADPPTDHHGRPGNSRVYKWSTPDRPWAIRVWADTSFIAPTMLLRREDAHEARAAPPTAHARCFHTGVVVGVNDSAVALSVCGGLRGVIRKGSDVYFIEPAEENSDLDSENKISDDNEDNEIFETGRRLHTFRSSGVMNSLTQGRSKDALTSSEGRQETKDAEMHNCDARGKSYIDTHEGVDAAPHHRTRRYLYSHKYTIEVLVVIDNKMARYHGKHIDQYVLTLMSVVALIFRDSSIGNRIDIAIVEVLRPERQTFVPKRSYENNAESMGKSAEEMLKLFCKWQKQGLKYNANHPRRYDTALLLTRENICRNPWTKSCDTLGLAELGTMCSKHSSCAIVQDNGLSAAFTIAHELGHLLNMPHDNDDKCRLLRSATEDAHRMNVMSRMLDHNTLPWVWSNCSRHYLTEYLHGGHGQCLEEEPWTNKLVEDEMEITLAGELFNASKQCQYVFGKTSRICPYMPTCKRLWCTTSSDEKEGCRTQHMPWADGTICAQGKWCLRGKCEEKNKRLLRKIHGEWGDWLAWSSCSRTCGVGVRRAERKCDAPEPKYGGSYCTGERVRYESCIMRPCPSDAIDFRTQQCQQYNNKNFGLPDIPNDVRWVPKYASIRREDSCKLFCQVLNNTRTYFQLREKVEDGTPCGPDTYDICVNGECRVAGCDYVLNSTAKADNCGVCNGDNSTCIVTTGSVEDPRPYGYSDIHVVPKGAAMIDITQTSYKKEVADDNFLALVDMETGEYLLNGHWIVTPFQKLVEFGGTLLEYTGSNAGVERINSTKPLQKKLLVQILSVGDLTPPYVSYSFTKSNLHSTPNYYWRLGDWSNCTQPCVGERQRTAYCVRTDTGDRARDDMCRNHQRPAPLIELCSHSCPASWTYQDWTPCELVGEECLRRREVIGCMSSLGNAVDKERCEGDKPNTQERCSREECPAWKYHEWAPCACPDGKTTGERRRPYSCHLRGRSVQDWQCDHLGKPVEVGTCSCWYVEGWSSLCEINGEGSSEELKRHEKKGRRRKSGRARERKGGEGGGGGEDGPTCGSGIRHRRVTCGDPEENLADSHCDPYNKPSNASECHVPCPTTTTTTTTTTTPPPSTSTTSTLSSTLTPDLTHSVSSFDTPSNENNGRNHHNQDNSVHNPYHNNGRGSSWQQHHRGVQDPHQVTPWGQSNSQETNELPKILPSSLDERERSNRDDFSDNRVDNKDHHSRYNWRRGKDRGHHNEDQWNDSGYKVQQNSEEESNSVVQEYEDHYKRKNNWQTGDWTMCSRDCGGGEKRRQVVCLEGTCPMDEKPADVAPCNTDICTEWSTGGWGHCRMRQRERERGRQCGRGNQQRLVVCRDMKGVELKEDRCHAADRPTHTRSCKVPCNSAKQTGRRQRYRWKIGDWSTCSEECDRGVKHREITCIDTGMNYNHGSVMSGGVEVHSDYCLREGLSKPKERRGCNKHPCPFRWVASPWSECSKWCDAGVQFREVTCHAINALGWIDPDPSSYGCRENKRPRNTRKCNLGDCSGRYFWRVKPWKPCQASCGEKGRQRRTVTCVDSQERKVSRSRCQREHKPKKRQKCFSKPCGHTTCAEAREALHVTVDGEYSLLVAGRNMSIFCLGMNSSVPREYLTLPAGEEGNFAEMYNKILYNPETCPYDGERRSDCECGTDESDRAGYTAFSRIRINTTSLSVDTYDFTFARAVEGRLVPYGEAGDCYSQANCPQGAFSINLAGTALAVSSRSNWLRKGTHAAHWINRLDDNQRVLGRCGGYCGTCSPDPSVGLKLDLRDG